MACGIRRRKDLRPVTAVVRPAIRLQQTIIYHKCERSSAALLVLYMFGYTSRMQNVIALERLRQQHIRCICMDHHPLGKMHCLVLSSPSCFDH